MSVVKRFFFYAIAIVTLGMFAGGVGTIIGSIADYIVGQFSTQVGRGDFTIETLSMGLALTIIGGAIWFMFWRSIQKAVNGNIEEMGSALRAWYLNLVLFGALSSAIVAATGLISWLIGGLDALQFSGSFLANLLVGAVVWYYHHRLREKEGQPSSAAKTLKRWYVYIFSGWGLVWVIVGFVRLLFHIIVWLPIWGATVSSGSFQGSVLGFDIGFLVVGAFVWWLHWLRLAKGDFASTLRQVYLYLLTILGSVIAGLVALATTIYNVLRYVLGGATGSSAIYFQFLGWTLPLMLVAFGVWTYHRHIAREESGLHPEMRSSARRVYSYLMSLVGLGSLIAGAVTLLGLLLRLLAFALSSSTEFSLSGGYWQSYLSLTLALLIVGVPLWVFYWQKIIRMVDDGGIEERRARTRRIYLYLLVAASIIALATGLSNVVYQILAGSLQSKAGSIIFREMIWGLQAILVALPVMLYHWGILRHDQRLGAEVVAAKKKTITLLAAGPAAQQLFDRIEAKFGAKPRLLHYQAAPEETPAVLNDTEIEQAFTAIENSAAAKILLVFTARGLMVLPYEDK